MVEDEALAEDKSSSKWDGDKLVGITGELVYVPQPEVPLMGQIQGIGRQAHGVLFVD